MKFDPNKKPVIRKGKSGAEVVFIDVEDVIAIYTENRIPVYRTPDGEFYEMTQFSELQECYCKYSNFIHTDRGYLVRLDRIELLEVKQRKVFFDKIIDRNSFYITVARSKISKVKEIVKKVLGSSKIKE